MNMNSMNSMNSIADFHINNANNNIPNLSNHRHHNNKYKVKSKSTKKREKNKKRKNKQKHQQILTNSDHTNFETISNTKTNKKKKKNKNKRKRKRSPSSTISTNSTISEHDDSDLNLSVNNRYAEDDDNNNHQTLAPMRPRRKRRCNLDKEFDEEERRILNTENMRIHDPVSDNPFVVAYAEELHLDEFEMEKNEYFPILKEMPRTALIKYCDYYKLRYSKRSKDNRLLQIVTKHFIIHNREKNTLRSIEDMERDLFWHSVCHRWNTKEKKEKEKQ